MLLSPALPLRLNSVESDKERKWRNGSATTSLAAPTLCGVCPNGVFIRIMYHTPRQNRSCSASKLPALAHAALRLGFLSSPLATSIAVSNSPALAAAITEMAKDIGVDVVRNAPEWAREHSLTDIDFTYGVLYGTKRQSNKKDWHILRNMAEVLPRTANVTGTHRSLWSLAYQAEVSE